MGLTELFLTAEGRVRLRDLLFGFDGRMSRGDFWLAMLATIIVYLAIAAILLVLMIPYVAVCVALIVGIFAIRRYRQNWLLWSLIYVLLLLLLSLLGWVTYVRIGLTFILFSLMFFAAVLALNSGVAIASKRLHDLGWSGWWQLVFWAAPVFSAGIGSFAGSTAASVVSFVLFAGTVVLYGCLRGNQGPNKYGPDPLATTSDTYAAA